jgi:hypothetical protein
MRRLFNAALFRQLGVIWPILSGVLSGMICLGLLIGYLEGWRVDDALYFTFVTGLTIGYGDLTPHRTLSRLLAVGIGFAGIMLTGLVAAVIVQALRATDREGEG